MEIAYALITMFFWGYGLAFLAALCLVLILLNNSTKWQISGAVVVIMIFIYPLLWPELTRAWAKWTHADWSNEYKGRYNRGKKLFDERCKTAGVKIYKQADDVDGVLLLDVPLKSTDSVLHDPNWKYAALQWDDEFLDPDDYIYHYTYSRRYKYVDVQYSGDDIRRYAPINPPELYSHYDPNNRKPVENNVKDPARYAISLASVADATGRAYGIAGITLTITDMQTHTVMATGTWYAFNPWFEEPIRSDATWQRGAGETCPSYGPNYISDFAVVVLRPRKEIHNKP